MKEKQSEFLLQIKNGVVDFYWGLKIETELSFAKVCDNIQRTVNGAFEKYNNHIRTIIEQDASRTIQEQKMQNELHVKSAKNRAVTENNATVEEQADVCGFEIELMANGVKIIPRTLLYEYLSFWTSEMDYDVNYSGEVYGDIYTNSQRRFILPPIKIELENGVVTLLSAVLFAFPDKTAILRITLPIDDTDSLYLKQNEIDSYIVNAVVHKI